MVNASMYLLVKKLRERVTLTFTDPKMHYCVEFSNVLSSDVHLWE
jgi:hypothetical protein